MPENNEKEPQYKSILSDDDGTARLRSSSASSAKRRSC